MKPASNPSGQSVLQALIGAGMVGILVVATLQVSTLGQNHEASLKQGREFDELTRKTTLALSDPATCSCNLAPQDLLQQKKFKEGDASTTSFDFPALGFYGEACAMLETFASTAATTDAGALALSRIQLSKFRKIDATSYSATLSLQGKRVGALAGGMTREFHVLLETAVSGTDTVIARCYQNALTASAPAPTGATGPSGAPAPSGATPPPTSSAGLKILSGRNVKLGGTTAECPSYYVYGRRNTVYNYDVKYNLCEEEHWQKPITFSQAFTKTPHVFLAIEKNNTSGGCLRQESSKILLYPTNITSTGFTARGGGGVVDDNNCEGDNDRDFGGTNRYGWYTPMMFSWIAIGE